MCFRSILFYSMLINRGIWYHSDIANILKSIFTGIFAAAQLVLPKDCKSNKMCEISKMILGPTVQFYITGQFEWKKIRIATGFANIRLWDGLYFHKLELYVEVRTDLK